jgi:hypothetical protein
MTRALTLAAACVTAAVIVAPAQARGPDALPEVRAAHPVNRAEPAPWLGWEPWQETYLSTYAKAHEAGLDVGRNLVDDGLASGEPATRERIESSTARMEAWLNPPEPEPEPAAPAPVETAAPAASSSGGYAIPSYIVECESGGDYGALNASGAGGAYQIMPGTWQAYGGTGSPHTAPPEEQDRIAAAIYAAEGSSPWVCG